MAVDVKIGNDCITAVLSGELDHHTCAEIRTKLDTQLEAFTPTLLILDFSGVSFMDSSGIGLILGRARLQSGYNGRLVIKNANEAVRKIIALAGLSGYMVDSLANKQKSK